MRSEVDVEAVLGEFGYGSHSLERPETPKTLKKTLVFNVFSETVFGTGSFLEMPEIPKTLNKNIGFLMFLVGPSGHWKLSRNA